MKKAIIGRKLGMTQIFDEAGLMIPVTVVQAGPMTVVRKKTNERDGYEALVCAFGDIREKRLNKPQMGVFKKTNTAPKKIIREFKLPLDICEIGKDITCEIFEKGDIVDVIGTSKGHGFSGSIKRWNQHRLKMTHGTGPVHREVGSQGMRSDPGRVIKGMHMPGQFGHDRVTIQNLRVAKVDAAKGVLLIMGGLPGPKGGLVTIRDCVKK